jgi:hypothetical protein
MGLAANGVSVRICSCQKRAPLRRKCACQVEVGWRWWSGGKPTILVFLDARATCMQISNSLHRLASGLCVPATITTSSYTICGVLDCLKNRPQSVLLTIASRIVYYCASQQLICFSPESPLSSLRSFRAPLRWRELVSQPVVDHDAADATRH